MVLLLSSARLKNIFVLYFYVAACFIFPTCSNVEHPGYSVMSLWENESQLDLHRTIKCSNHDVSDCWSGLTWMPNEFYLATPQLLSWNGIVFGIVFVNQKTGGWLGSAGLLHGGHKHRYFCIILYKLIYVLKRYRFFWQRYRFSIKAS